LKCLLDQLAVLAPLGVTLQGYRITPISLTTLSRLSIPSNRSTNTSTRPPRTSFCSSSPFLRTKQPQGSPFSCAAKAANESLILVLPLRVESAGSPIALVVSSATAGEEVEATGGGAAILVVARQLPKRAKAEVRNESRRESRREAKPERSELREGLRARGSGVERVLSWIARVYKRGG